MLSSATFSPCRRYRYVLRRTWDAAGQTVLFIGLNPSTADAKHDDPTIRRCIRFAADWGFGSLIVANLFAYRATKPADLRRAADPIGPRNNFWLAQLQKQADLTIAAWGIHGAHLNRDRHVLGKLSRLHCLGKTKAGHPRHPLYLAATARPSPLTHDSITPMASPTASRTG
ncbi:MAG: DUF1643 domain-containing protein [Tepidisphaeraceae bacterium]|jgi:hypothetical protein